jgi:hypothetical protein
MEVQYAGLIKEVIFEEIETNNEELEKQRRNRSYNFVHEVEFIFRGASYYMDLDANITYDREGGIVDWKDNSSYTYNSDGDKVELKLGKDVLNCILC